MKYTATFTIGNTTHTIEQEVGSHKEYFQAAAFWDSLPRVGPNGETDLIIVHRTPKKDGEYLSYIEIQCPSAKKRFEIGEHKQSKRGMYPKTSRGWIDLGASRDDEEEEQEEPKNTRSNNVENFQSAAVKAKNEVIELLMRYGKNREQATATFNEKYAQSSYDELKGAIKRLADGLAEKARNKNSQTGSRPTTQGTTTH